MIKKRNVVLFYLLAVLFTALSIHDYKANKILVSSMLFGQQEVLKVVIILLSWIVISLVYLLLEWLQKRKVSYGRTFVFLWISLGILYFVLLPALNEPDSKNHFCRSYEISQGQFISPFNDSGSAVDYFSIPQGWAEDDGDSIRVTHTQIYQARSFQIGENSKLHSYTNIALYSPFSYLPQAFGMFLAGLVTKNFMVIVNLGRLFNYLCTGLLLYGAIRLIPVGKKYILLLSMFPLFMQEAIGLAPDAMTIALVVFLLAIVLQLRYTDRMVTTGVLIVLYVTSFLLSQYKIVYVVFCLTLFLIPKNKFGRTRNYYINVVGIGTVVSAASLIWLRISSYFLLHHYGDTDRQIIFIRTHFINYLLVMFRSIFVYGAELWDSMMGEAVAAYDMQLRRTVLYIFMLVFIGSLCRDYLTNRKAGNSDHGLQVNLLGCCALATILIMTSEYIQYNSFQNLTISGMQGRYFLPMLVPLMILVGKSREEQYTETNNIVPAMIGINFCFLVQAFLSAL